MRKSRFPIILLGITGSLLVIVLVIAIILLTKPAAAKPSTPSIKDTSLAEKGDISATAQPVAEGNQTASPVETDATLPETDATLPDTEATPVPTVEPTPEPTVVPDTGTPTIDFPREGLKVVPELNELFSEVQELTICAANALHVRVGPGTEYESLVTVKRGEVLKTFAMKNDWFLVEYQSGKAGWVSAKYAFGMWMFDLAVNANLNGMEKPASACEVNSLFVSAQEGANVRSAPNTSAQKLDTWKVREEVLHLGTTGSWYFCNYKGKFGWVSESNFSETQLSTLKDGTHLYSFGAKAKITEKDGVYTIPITIRKPVVLTEKEASDVMNGTSIKKKGIHFDASDITDGSLMLQYSKAHKGYLAYYYGVQCTYASGSGTIVLDAESKIVDYGYVIYDTFTASEKKTYGIGSQNASFKSGKKFASYVALLRKKGGYSGMFGSVTIKNGVVTKLVSEFAS